MTETMALIEMGITLIINVKKGKKKLKNALNLRILSLRKNNCLSTYFLGEISKPMPKSVFTSASFFIVHFLLCLLLFSLPPYTTPRKSNGCTITGRGPGMALW